MIRKLLKLTETGTCTQENRSRCKSEIIAKYLKIYVTVLDYDLFFPIHVFEGSMLKVNSSIR